MLIRLDKYLSDMGLGTRSQVKELIKKGHIEIDGQKILKSDIKIDSLSAIVTCDGETVRYEKFEYYMLNKPSGVVSAVSDKKDKTVIDLLGIRKRKDMFPIGRLDKDTEGLLIISNDGELAHNLLTPSKHVDKTYYAVVKGQMTQREVDAFADGVVINADFKAKPAKLDIIDTHDDVSFVYVTIHEGKFHQVKKMFLACGSEVVFLRRISMGKLQLDDNLKTGEYRKLTNEEINILKQYGQE